jgi:hypothetical protein
MPLPWPQGIENFILKQVVHPQNTKSKWNKRAYKEN